MVIEKVINEKGEVKTFRYMYDRGLRTSIIEECTFYYRKVYVIDGETFFLGSYDKGRTDTLIEAVTFAPAVSSVEVTSFTDENILSTMQRKLSKHECSTLHDVVAHFQNNISLNRISLWQINLVML